MPTPPASFERHMRPFIALQAAVSAFGGFAGVFVQADHGAAALVAFAAVMLTTAGACIVASHALGSRWRVEAAQLVRAGFVLPLLLLPLAVVGGASPTPLVLALACGSFLGLTWGARHWLELHALADAERDAYATQAVALAVGVALLTTLAVSSLLAATGERRGPVLALFMLLSAAGAVWAPRHLPASPPVRWVAPLQVVRQPGFKACLPLFFLESGLLGVGVVLNASGAVRALGQASHYGWAASAATLAGALALLAARRHRHSANRARWMRWACAGMVAAAALLGSSAWWPVLFVLHLLVQSAVGPFWAASEHVLNQRAMDLHGSVGDRIVAREAALAMLRLAALGGFWAVASALGDQQRLVFGAALVAGAALLEYRLARAWLGNGPGHPAS